MYNGMDGGLDLENAETRRQICADSRLTDINSGGTRLVLGLVRRVAFSRARGGGSVPEENFSNFVIRVHRS